MGRYNMLDKQDYFLLRRKKRITLTEIAKAIGCSQSLLSKHETSECNMCSLKIKKYKKYIENK